MRAFGFTRQARARRRATAWGAALLACAGTFTSAQAQGGANVCRAALAGFYLADIATEAGTFASRALVTLHADGTLDVVDSRQHQGVHGSSFSAQRGAWRCTGARAATAVTLNFGFPPQESIARSDWAIRLEPAGVLRGTIELRVFYGVNRVDPFALGGRQFGVFRFGAVPVTPRN